MPHRFQLEIDGIHAAMEGQQWDAAIRALEAMQDVPADCRGTFVSDLLFKLYLARNRWNRLVDLFPTLNENDSRRCLVPLLLLRNIEIGYAIEPGFSLDPAATEAALACHLKNYVLAKDELPLCLSLLASLRRPELLFDLLKAFIKSGGFLTDEIVEPAFACYLQMELFDAARRLLDFLRAHDPQHLALERYDYLLRRASGSCAPPGDSQDKVLRFLKAAMNSNHRSPRSS